MPGGVNYIRQPGIFLGVPPADIGVSATPNLSYIWQSRA